MSEFNKLSQAIREGANIRPQAKGAPFTYDSTIGQTCSCAIGAAVEAAVPDFEPTYNYDFNKCFHIQTSTAWRTLCETLGLNEDEMEYHPHRDRVLPLVEVISSLNDVYGYTREAIADYLENKGY